MAYFHCLIGGGSSGGGYELTVTCDADFAGTTITCTDGVTTLTQTCPSASPYNVVFAIPNGGEWTISGIISGQTHSASIDIPDSLELHSVPEGSTVLPTDDIQTWLACAGIKDKSYTTLNEVLSDSTTLLALMSDDNAVDYLVRSTTWASGIPADSTAMTDIGANNYCANTLLADATWRTAICNSTYFESVLNTKVPTMTSATTPSGEASASSTDSTYYPWKAFNNNPSSTDAWSSGSRNAGWIQYMFSTQLKVYKLSIKATIFSNKRMGAFVIRGSNDGTNWSNSILSDSIQSANVENFVIPSDTKYKYWRLEYSSYTDIVCVAYMNYYGRVDV